MDRNNLRKIIKTAVARNDAEQCATIVECCRMGYGMTYREIQELFHRSTDFQCGPAEFEALMQEVEHGH